MTGDGVVRGMGDVVKVVFTVASVNMLQFKLTINRTKVSIMVVVTRIKLVTSFLLLELEITLVVMVPRFELRLVRKITPTIPTDIVVAVTRTPNYWLSRQ